MTLLTLNESINDKKYVEVMAPVMGQVYRQVDSKLREQLSNNTISNA